MEFGIWNLVSTNPKKEEQWSQSGQKESRKSKMTKKREGVVARKHIRRRVEGKSVHVEKKLGQRLDRDII